MSDFLRRLQLRLGHQFSNPALLDQALTHRSSSKNHYERLEYLGDALLGVFVAEELFRKFPDGREGQLTRLRARLVKKETLAEIARELDLGSCLNLGSGELKSGGRQRPSILADALEAVICAIYLDSTFEVCRQVVLQWYCERLQNLTLNDEQRDPKTRLQEVLQGRQSPLPEYRLVAEPPSPIDGGEPNFQVACKVTELDEEIIATGPSRRIAEQTAAAQVLEQINVGK